jgi:hypothetical protein
VAAEVSLPEGAIYLYALTAQKTSKPRAFSVAGIDGTGRIVSLPADSFTAWISAVDAAGFAAQLERNVENLEWLAGATLRHQEAINAIAKSTRTTMLPTRFGVVFSGVQALAADIRARERDLKASIKRVQGCEEWGVKVFRVAQPSARIFITATSGADYLRKKAEALEGDGAGADPQIKEFSSALSRIARAVTQTGKVSSGQQGLQWQATFLVPASRRKQWDNVLRKYATAWGEERSIECTGPWPPYSFVNG